MCLPEVTLVLDEWSRMQSERQGADDLARLLSFGTEEARHDLAKNINENIDNALKA